MANGTIQTTCRTCGLDFERAMGQEPECSACAPAPAAQPLRDSMCCHCGMLSSEGACGCDSTDGAETPILDKHEQVMGYAPAANPTPWRAKGDALLNSRGELIAVLTSGGSDSDVPALLARIVAAVNAEQVHQENRDEIDVLAQEKFRAEQNLARCVEALRVIVREFDNGRTPLAIDVSECRSALAAVKGGE